MRCAAIILAALATYTPAPTHAESDAGVAEADRLFAAAEDRWSTDSTSTDSETLLRKALTLREARLPPTDPRITRTQDQLGRVFYNRAQQGESGSKRPSAKRLSNLIEAEHLFSQAAEAEARHRPGSLPLADDLGDWGAALREQGRFANALLKVCESLAIRHELLPPSAGRIGASLNNISRILGGLGDSASAARLGEDATRIAAGTSEGDPGGQALDQVCGDAVTS